MTNNSMMWKLASFFVTFLNSNLQILVLLEWMSSSWDLSYPLPKKKKKKTKTQGGLRMVIYSCHLQHLLFLMFEKSKFRLRLLEIGRIHWFTNAKTHRAGGFFQQGESICALIRKVGLGLFALAFHTQISFRSRCQVHSHMSGWSVKDLGGFTDACRTAFQWPTEKWGSRAGSVRSSNRQICLIVQIKNMLVMQTTGTNEELWSLWSEKKKQQVVSAGVGTVFSHVNLFSNLLKVKNTEAVSNHT